MAFLLGPLIGVVPKIATSVVGGIQGNNADKEFRNGWTQQQLSVVSGQNSGKNIMIVYPKHTANFQGSQQQQLQCQTPNNKQTISYDCYVFDSGNFELQGDGGYLNWAFTGNFKRDGNKVTFMKP
ncbi:hypothetical protein LTR85_004131 [Meristemomyces frigidus]|nr:hypothetical protein LTR85_004131 [Meristemomyces frigidus]